MKKVICFLVILIIGFTTCTAQTHKKTKESQPTNEEVVRFLDNFVKNKLQDFIGKPAIQLYEYLKKESPFEVKHVSTISDKEWPRGDEKEYMIGVTFYNQSDEDMDEKNVEVVVIDIYLNIQWDTDEFWHALPDEGWDEVIIKRTEQCKVTNFEYEKTKIHIER